MATLPHDLICGWRTFSIESKGMQREFLMWTPGWFCSRIWQNYEFGFYFPIILLIHGFTSSAKSLGSMMHIDDRVRMPLVFPVGYEASWNAVYCCGPAMTQGIDDLQYIDDVIWSVRQKFPTFYNDDSFRWMVGHSNGAFMVSHYAMNRHIDAAFISQGHVYQFPPDINPTSVALVWGERDEVVSPAGCCVPDQCCCEIMSSTCVNHTTIFDRWAHINQCKGWHMKVQDNTDGTANCQIGLGCLKKTESCMYLGTVHRVQNSLTIFPWFRDVSANHTFGNFSDAQVWNEFPQYYEPQEPLYNPTISRRGQRDNSKEVIWMSLVISVSVCFFIICVLYLMKTFVLDKWHARYMEVTDYDFGHEPSDEEELGPVSRRLKPKVKRRKGHRRLRPTQTTI